MTNVVRLSKSPPVRQKMNGSGFILCYRSIQDKDWYNTDLPKTMLFMHCLMNAQHTVYASDFRNKRVTLQAGQLHTTFSIIAKKSGLWELYENYVKSKDVEGACKKAIKRCLDFFVKDGSLTYEVLGSGKKATTVITISNWGKFQSLPVTKAVTNIVTKETQLKQGVQGDSVTKQVTKPVTLNNNTISTNVDIERSCPEQSSEPQDEPTGIKLHLNKKNTFHHVSKQSFDEYVELFPAVDVLQQFRKMYLWLRDNPKRRKTKAGIKNFINQWLGKEQDKGGSHENIGNGSKFNFGQQRSVSPIEKAKAFIEQNGLSGDLPSHNNSVDET